MKQRIELFLIRENDAPIIEAIEAVYMAHHAKDTPTKIRAWNRVQKHFSSKYHHLNHHGYKVKGCRVIYTRSDCHFVLIVEVVL